MSCLSDPRSEGYWSNLHLVIKNVPCKHQFLGSIVESIPVCHAGDRGSLNAGEIRNFSFWLSLLVYIQNITKIFLLFPAGKKRGTFSFPFFFEFAIVSVLFLNCTGLFKNTTGIDYVTKLQNILVHFHLIADGLMHSFVHSFIGPATQPWILNRYK